MATPDLATEICIYLHQLPLEQQRHVLEFIRALVTARVQRVPGQALLRFAGTIDASDLAIMSQAIKDGCEQIRGREGVPR